MLFFFLLKLDVTDGLIFAGEGCLAHESSEEESNPQNEDSSQRWGSRSHLFVQHLTLLVPLSNFRKGQM